MPELNTHLYYAARALEARQLANEAGNERMRDLHMRNAESYDALAVASGEAGRVAGIDGHVAPPFAVPVAGSADSHHVAPSPDSLALMLTDAMPQMLWSTRPDGYYDYYNAQWYAFTGMAEGATDGTGWNEMFHPDDRERAWKLWQACLQSGDPYEIEYRLRHVSGVYRWTLGRALPVRDPSGGIGRWIGTCTDIDRLKKAEELSASLTREMSHRIANLFAVISGLIAMKARSETSVTAFATNMQSRIAALAAAHLLVTMPTTKADGSLVQSGLHAMIAHILQPFSGEEERLSLIGEDVIVDDGAATAIALIFHELSTNAAKYGSLSAEFGRVAIHTTVSGNLLSIRWIESGGPIPPSTVIGSGFGTRLTDRTVAQQLGGSITRFWEPTGLIVQMEIDMTTLRRHG